MNRLLSLLRNSTHRYIACWIFLCLCLDGLYWLLLAVRPGGQAYIASINDTFGLLGPLLALPLYFKLSGGRKTCTPLLMGLATFAFTIGQGVWSYYDLVLHQSPYPSLADVLYLSSYPLLLIGIVRIPTRQLPGISRARVVLDGLMTMTSVITFSWYFILGPTTLQGNETLLAKIIGTAYPSFDLVLLLCVLLLWGVSGNKQLRLALLLLSLGLLTIALTDSLFDYISLQGGYTSGNLIAPLWGLGYQVVGLGAFVLRQLQKQADTQRKEQAFPRPSALWRSLLPYALLPFLGLLLLYTWNTPGNSILQAGVYIGATLLIFLIFVRQIIAMQEVHTLHTNNGLLASLNTQLEVQATHDALTGLPNRNLLAQHLEQLTATGQEDTGSSALLLLDLDRFKEVNDTLGHQVGDHLLQQIGPRLQTCLRPCDLIARLGGDEFALLLPDIDTTEAIQVAGHLLQALSTPFLVHEHALDIGGSIGIALAPEHGFNATTLLRCADVAMYAAKRSQSGYAVYTNTIDQHSPQKLTLMSTLRQAITNDELQLYYQPKISLSEERIIGVEALIRWHHPEYGLIPPDAFIPQAEQTGLIDQLTYWVLEQAIRQCHEWEVTGLHLNVAVNLSAHTLYNTDLFCWVTNLLQRYSVAPEHITLEITENMCMEDPEKASMVLAQLRALGIAIAIDDFGTGYSSLAYVKRLPVDEIKIDKTFVLGLGKDGDSADLAIIQAVVAMARPLKCKVVAEGVENAHTGMLLRKFGCDLAQGYYYSRPIPAASLENLARTSSWGIGSGDIHAAS